MTYTVGQRVQNKPHLASVYEGTGWLDKMKLARGGEIIEVPLFTRTNGEGTILVEWDSLVGMKAHPSEWQCWVHTAWIGPEGAP